MASSGNRELTRIASKKIAAVLTCQICNMLLRNATTITECLHTFCRKCIYKKFTEEGLDSCPVCKTYLGCDPFEKLRSDYSIQCMRTMILGSESRREREEPKAESSDPLPNPVESKVPEKAFHVPSNARGREKFLNSSVRPAEPSNSIATKSRRSAGKRVSVSRRSRVLDEPVKAVEDRPETSSPGMSLGTRPNEKKSYSVGGSSQLHEGISKTSKAPVQELASKSSPSDTYKDEEHMSKSKYKEPANKSTVHEEEGGSNPPQAGPGRQDQIHKGWQKSAGAQGSNAAQLQAMVNSGRSIRHGGISPIWFSLVASASQKGKATLPQISPRFLKIKNAELPVSYIQKYLVQKLNLNHENEVEITVKGRLLDPQLRLRDLMDLWLQTTPSEKILTTVGSSAEDFVMVLCYARICPTCLCRST